MPKARDKITGRQRVIPYDIDFMQWLDRVYPYRDFRNSRKAFNLYHNMGVSVKDIAAKMACTTNNVNYLKREFLKIINSYLEQKNA